MRGLAALLFALLPAVAADDDPTEVLVRARDTLIAHTQRIPSHTCVETVTRHAYEYLGGSPPRSCDALLGRRKLAGVGALIRLATTDRLRLDVALADSREIFAWTGAARFDDREVDQFVPPGAMGTGAFGATLLELFARYDPTFTYERESVIAGRRLMEYSFVVPETESHYRVKADGQWMITGYTGTLRVDPLTAELVQFTIRTEELPAATRLCESETTLDYGSVRLGSEDYILPAVSRQRFIEQDGSEDENVVTFSACREFRGESSLSFGPAIGVPEQSPAGKPALLELPERLPVWVQITSPLSLDQAAAGDVLEGHLSEPIRSRAKVLVPAGAALQGRVVRAGTTYGTPDQGVICLRWNTVEVDGVTLRLAIVPDIKPRSPNAKLDLFDLTRTDEPRYAVYRFPGTHVTLNSLPPTKWFTETP